MAIPEPAALRVNEAARYLGISRANLYRLFQSGDLKPAKIGGRTLVRRIDADALLERSVVGDVIPIKPDILG